MWRQRTRDIMLRISEADLSMIPDLSSRSRATALLATADSGDGVALERLVPLLYDELRAMAHRELARERRNETLQTTALVHEAYLKLVDDSRVTRRGRAYFFAAAARAMRQVLVDYARRRNAVKRGGGAQVLSLDEGQVAVDEFAAELLDLDRALEQLATLNPRHARVVECRFFAGMSVEETAESLGVSPRTVKYDWALARAWLFDALDGEERDPATL
jgi:RNA polymerase sigma-70 factor, ECF subfamily